ncbi:hypothetical protein DFJ58DRAFT_847335 [Suillus subalutaceus]|uniref:uncharacterized protein n=1 Tax=Suillus subalutaceus TaxID=48586 RepID=UPI001B8636F7|nr:uncharacterized protein DFJ58DRAFT_847335 [Suillus subalutaceus]KAG1835834.1 hypothetical protein DFJ58DRAFT_847335 [Suillus subalutaceus]
MPTFTLSLEGVGKVITIRLKRQGHTQHNTRTADHEDGSIPTDLSSPVPAPIHSSNSSPNAVSASSEPGLEEFSNGTGFPSAEYPWGASRAREALDIVQRIIGNPSSNEWPSQTRNQNKAALDDLHLRLHRLCCYLCNAPPALDRREHSRRDPLS